MKEIVTDWLPKEAFAEEAVKSALADLVMGWSQRWFARGAAVIAAVRTKEGRQSPATQIQGAVAAADMSGPGKRRLLEAALDIDLAGQVLGEGDHQVLDAFAAQIAGDLIAALDKALGGESTDGKTAEIHLTLSVAGGDMLMIALPAHSLVPKLKAQFGPAQRSSKALRNRMEALKPIALTAEALLGHAELAVNDLKGLSVGDVLILDRALNEPVELRLAGSDRQIGRGRLVRNGAQMSIQF